jgi:hypothetical protein
VDREAGFVHFEGWSLDQLLNRFDSVRTENPCVAGLAGRRR